MDISHVLVLVNELVGGGVIERYAVAGAVGATFYVEPLATMDVDIIVAVPPPPGALLVPLQAVYDYCVAHGATREGEHIVVGGWPIQFLPPTGRLREEALRKVRTLDVNGTPVAVLAPEYLAADALETGRAKDLARLLQFVQEAAMDMPTFIALCERFGLTERWSRFRAQFGDSQ